MFKTLNDKLKPYVILRTLNQWNTIYIKWIKNKTDVARDINIFINMQHLYIVSCQHQQQVMQGNPVFGLIVWHITNIWIVIMQPKSK